MKHERRKLSHWLAIYRVEFILPKVAKQKLKLALCLPTLEIFEAVTRAVAAEILVLEAMSQVDNMQNRINLTRNRIIDAEARALSADS